MAAEHTRENCQCAICAHIKTLVGDGRGKRYRVVQVKADGTTQVWGWTNELDGGTLAKAVQLHPDTVICRVEEKNPEAADA